MVTKKVSKGKNDKGLNRKKEPSYHTSTKKFRQSTNY